MFDKKIFILATYRWSNERSGHVWEPVLTIAARSREQAGNTLKKIGGKLCSALKDRVEFPYENLCLPDSGWKKLPRQDFDKKITFERIIEGRTIRVEFPISDTRSTIEKYRLIEKPQLK